MKCKKLYESYKEKVKKVENLIKRDKPVPIKLRDDIIKLYQDWEKCMKIQQNRGV